MNSLWNICTIDDLGSVNRGKSKHRPRNDAALFGGDYPFIQTGDVKRANLYIEDYSETYNDVGLQQSKLWKKNTLCITIAANIAESAILGIDACFPDSVVGFEPYKDKSNVLFVKYMMDMFKSYMQQISKGTTQDNLSLEKIRRVKFEAPDIEVQDKIANILSSYDFLIENNNKRIKILEQMAENLYKEWFVRFRFPGHETAEFENGIPKGWTRVLIREICEINKDTLSIKKAPSQIKYLDTSSITRGLISELQEMNFADAPSRARRIVKENSIVYSTVRPNLEHFGILKNVPANLVVSTGFAVLDCKEDVANIVYLALASAEITSYCATIAEGAVATYPSIRAEEIGKITIVIPPMSVGVVLNRKIETIFSAINNLQQQSVNLIRQRDLLLPRLMSGKLSV